MPTILWFLQCLLSIFFFDQLEKKYKKLKTIQSFNFTASRSFFSSSTEAEKRHKLQLVSLKKMKVEDD